MLLGERARSLSMNTMKASSRALDCADLERAQKEKISKLYHLFNELETFEMCFITSFAFSSIATYRQYEVEIMKKNDAKSNNVISFMGMKKRQHQHSARRLQTSIKINLLDISVS